MNLLELIRRLYPELLNGIRAELSSEEMLAEVRERVRAAEPEVLRRTGIEPGSVDLEARSIEVVMATDAPVPVVDFNRWEVVDEVLAMEGCALGEIRAEKLPFLDNHKRTSVRDVLGSILDLSTDEHRFIGREFWSAVEADSFTKAAEGHVDQRSLGYVVRGALVAEPGESVQAFGRTFTASATRPLRVATDWLPKECSATPIGADPDAGTRSENDGERSGARSRPVVGKTKGRKMNKELRALLVRLGMSGDSTDEQARSFAEGRGVDPEGTVAEARTALAGLLGLEVAAPPSGAGQRSGSPESLASGGEGSQTIPVGEEGGTVTRATNVEILDLFQPWEADAGMRTLRDTMLREENLTLADAQSRAIAALASSHPPVGGRVKVTQDEGETRRECMALSIQFRANPTVLEGEAVQKAQEYRGMTLYEMARTTLEAHGESVRGMSRLEIVGRAFTHSSGDFPYALEDSARKSLMAAYQESPSTWQAWCKRGSLSDFKTARIVKLGEFANLEEVPEGAEFPYTSTTEDRETIYLLTYGDIFSVTRQMIINDDLGAFTDVPAKFGRAWARTINRLPAQHLLANGNLNDGVALFHATHTNLQTGAGYKGDTVAHCQDAIEAMTYKLRMQTALAEEDATVYLNVTPSVVLIPPTYEKNWRQALYEGGLSSNNAPSWIREMGLQLAVEPELENPGLTGYSTTQSYLFGAPGEYPVVQVAFLDGNDAPFMESQNGFDVDGTKWKVRGDVGVGTADFRGGAKATGA